MAAMPATQKALLPLSLHKPLLSRLLNLLRQPDGRESISPYPVSFSYGVYLQGPTKHNRREVAEGENAKVTELVQCSCSGFKKHPKKLKPSQAWSK